MNEVVEEIPPQTAVLTVTGWETLLREGDGSELVNNAATGHYWELEEGHGFGVVYSAGMRANLELDFGVWLAEFAVAAVVISADDGKPWEVMNEEESADVLLEDEAELEDMKLWEKKIRISIYSKIIIEILN